MSHIKPAAEPARSEAGGLVLKVGLVLVALLVAAGAVVGFGVLPDRAGSNGRPTTGPASRLPPAPGPGLSLAAPPAAPAVLASAASGQPISMARLRKQVGPKLALPGLGRHFGFAVAQLGNPAAAWSHGAPGVTPASTLKLLTTTAALSVLGPEHRFTTSVVRGGTLSSIVLVGGGDPLLSESAPAGGQATATYPLPASLEELAGATAARLRSLGIPRVRLGYDASLFTGPAVNPHWPSSYLPQNVVSPISALWVDEGRKTPGLSPRSVDPALAAAEAFRVQLSDAGITVTGAVTEQSSRRTARSPVATVRSAPLEQIVQHILEQSDNEAAEVLLRQVAVAAGRPGSSSAGVATVRSELTRLGLDLTGARFYDGSGLSRDDVVPVSLLVDVIGLTADATHPQLRGVLTGLPVAGFSGSLGYRFESGGGGALGYVRAKTGTLTGVHALAGLATTTSGRTLVFAAVADRVAVRQTLLARADLDRIAAALTTCRC